MIKLRQIWVVSAMGSMVNVYSSTDSSDRFVELMLILSVGAFDEQVQNCTFVYALGSS